MDTGPGGEEAISLSLVVATLGSPELMRQLLGSLLAQRGASPFEVVIIDQGGADGLTRVVAEFPPVPHRRVEFRGASRTHNLGAQLAHGAWPGFPADDCEALPDTLRHADRARAFRTGVRALGRRG